MKRVWISPFHKSDYEYITETNKKEAMDSNSYGIDLMVIHN